ncbi:MAG: sodium-dependent transporter [Gammaproteobacteria bacterium]|nr:sodium-dependent transporter [Gammaproteobacteria bacterium]
MAENQQKPVQEDMALRDYGIRWSSNRLFVMAGAGAVIGLNNIWQFPYLVGEHGGGLFLLVYVLAVLVIGLPLMMTEFAVGRLGRGSPIQTVRALVDKTHGDPNWVVLGSIKTFAGFIVLSYLSVIAGWLLAYVVRSSLGMFQDLTADGMSAQFSGFVSDPEKQLFWHSLFVIMTTVVAARGLQRGFEKAVRVLVPLLFVLLLALLAYTANFNTIAQAATRIFAMDVEAFTWTSAMMAIGHAFFSLGLGYGVIMMYGTYIREECDITRSSIMIILIDLAVAIIAAIIVYGLLIAGQQSISSGPTLVFQTLPLALDNLRFGYIVMPLLFVMLVIIAWLSSIALVEPAIVWLIECHDTGRFNAAVIAGLGVWLLGLVTLLSFNVWSFEFSYFGINKYLGAFDILQIMTSHYMLPVSGLLLALYAGWSMEKTISMEMLGLHHPLLYRMWYGSIRFVIPLLMLMIIFTVPRLFL